jgi:hypothetical protein
MKKFFTVLFSVMFFTAIQGCAAQQLGTLPKSGLMKADPFSVWKTIQLEKDKSADGFRDALKKEGYTIDCLANYILGTVNLTIDGTRKVELVKVSMSDLGFTKETKGIDIYHKALSLGLKLCPREVGLELPLQYKDQPNGEGIVVASDPMKGPKEMPIDFLFSINRMTDGAKMLQAANGGRNYLWPPGEVSFIFSK